jgi:BlaI family penicillinase repressor
MMKPTGTLTRQELEIMKIVWQRGRATVRDVYEALRERRRIAYTTVLTMMRILEGKGYLARDVEERAHVYRPARAEQAVVRSMVREFVDRVFNGSAQPLLLHLVKDRKLTESEVEELGRLLKEIEKKEGGR